MVVFLVALAAVALLVVGLSITLMRKGHDIQGEVGENPHMRALGLDCALKDEHNPGGCNPSSTTDCLEQGCASCPTADRCNI